MLQLVVYVMQLFWAENNLCLSIQAASVYTCKCFIVLAIIKPFPKIKTDPKNVWLVCLRIRVVERHLRLCDWCYSDRTELDNTRAHTHKHTHTTLFVHGGCNPCLLLRMLFVQCSGYCFQVWDVWHRREIDGVNVFVGIDDPYNHLCYFDR